MTQTRRPIRTFARPALRNDRWNKPCPIVDPRSIPVYITNFNRLSYMRELVNWLLDAGTKRIMILDNGSTYPGLLEYYKNLPDGVELMALGKNHGPYAFWNLGLWAREKQPFIVTDPDLVPDADCPKDLILRMNLLLHDRPQSGKVGPGLKIDDVLDTEENAKINGWSLEYQKTFWKQRYNEQAFFGPIDTTFALYGVGYSEHDFGGFPENLRMDSPYVFRHMPWYVTTANMTDEERFYRSRTTVGPMGLDHSWSHLK